MRRLRASDAARAACRGLDTALRLWKSASAAAKHTRATARAGVLMLTCRRASSPVVVGRSPRAPRLRARTILQLPRRPLASVAG